MLDTVKTLNSVYTLKKDLSVISEKTAKSAFKAYFNLIEKLIVKHKTGNMMFVKEFFKSLNQIISKNPGLFASADSARPSLDISAQEALSLQPQNDKPLTYDAFFTWLWQVHTDMTYQTRDDWLSRQYLVSCICRCFCFVSKKMRDVHIPNMLKLIQEGLQDPHLRSSTFTSILTLMHHKIDAIVTKLLPFIAQNLQSWFVDAKTVYSQNVLIKLVTSIAQGYPEASNTDLTRKAMEALFNLTDQQTTSLQILNQAYQGLESLLINNSLSHYERKLVEAMTSMRSKPKSPAAQQSAQDKIKKVSMDLLNAVKNSPNKISQVASGMPRSISTTVISTLAAATNPKPEEKNKTDASLAPKKPDHQRQLSIDSFTSFFKSTPKPAPQPVATPAPTPAVPLKLPLDQLTPATPAEDLKPSPRITIDTTINDKMRVKRMLSMALMITCMYTSKSAAETSDSAINSENSRMNVLQLLQDAEFRKGDQRETEVMLRFAPVLLEEFFEQEQILPLIYGDFLASKTNPLSLSLLLHLHMPLLFMQRHNKAPATDTKHVIAQQSFGDWVKLTLDMLPMKKPVPQAVWSLLCFFMSVCMCANPQHEALYVNFGSYYPTTLDQLNDKVFMHAFLLYGLCFDRFLFANGMQEQQHLLRSTLQSLYKTERMELIDLLYTLLNLEFPFPKTLAKSAPLPQQQQVLSPLSTPITSPVHAYTTPPQSTSNSTNSTPAKEAQLLDFD